MKRTLQQVLKHMIEHCIDIADAVSRVKIAHKLAE